MRTISFNIDGGDATDTITQMLISLPRGGKRNSIKFDREGDKFTIAWRYAEGDWGVTFREPPTDPSRNRRRYASPVDAARAVVYRKHQGVVTTTG
jgi:hypothetical protein